jgi:hypothetical protein
VVHDEAVPADVAGKYPWVRWTQSAGGAHARNTGIRLSVGNYLVFMEAGQRLLREGLAIGLEALKSNSDSATVFGDSRGISDKSTSDQAPQLAAQDQYLALLSGSSVPRPAAAMYPREIFEHVAEFAGVGGSLLDYEMCLTIAKDFPIHCHGAAVAEHREEDIAADPGQGMRAALTILRAQRKHLKGNVQRQTAYREGVRHWRARYGPALVDRLRASLRAGELKRAREAMKLLLKFHPEALASWWRGRST